MPTPQKMMGSSTDQTSEEQYSGKKARVGWRKQSATIVFAVLFVAASLAAFYFYKQNKAIRENPNSVAQEELQGIVDRVGQLIVLPEGETPTLATVADPDKLRDQPFFAKAKVGDKVLLYTNAQKVILYDPAANKIVEVATLNIGQEQR